MVWVIITWETSTMVPLSCAPQDRIFHIHVWLDIRVFSRTQWECICSSAMKLADLVSRQHMVTCSCSPSLPLCSVVRCFKAYALFFLKKQVRNRKNMKISANHWELKINKDCENSQSLWFWKLQRLFIFKITGSWAFNFVKYHKNNREKPRPRPA